jgi:hypothetical protein
MGEMAELLRFSGLISTTKKYCFYGALKTICQWACGIVFALWLKTVKARAFAA